MLTPVLKPKDADKRMLNKMSMVSSTTNKNSARYEPLIDTKTNNDSRILTKLDDIKPKNMKEKEILSDGNRDQKGGRLHKLPNQISIRNRPIVAKEDAVGKLFKTKAKNSQKKSESPKYKPHTGIVSNNYQQFGGLGPAIGDDKWNMLSSRRKKMLSFSKNIDLVNKHSLGMKYEEIDSEDEENSERTNIQKGKNHIVLKERREKALSFAKSIKKPKVNSTAYDIMPDERFVGYDNNQYLLENQKIKMLFG